MQPGDILAIRGTSWLSRRILAATGDSVSHVGLIISSEPPLVIEALSRVRTDPLWFATRDAERAYILSPKNLSELQRTFVVERACAYSGDSYGYGKIALQGLDSVFSTTWWTDHFALGDAHPICSWLVAGAFAALGLNFGKPNQSVTPADIFNFAKSNPDKYETTVLTGSR